MIVETHWDDVWLDPDDWAEAFEAREPGTPHNEARDEIWEELLTILADKQDGDAEDDLLRRSLQQNRALRAAFNRAWPLLDAAGVVGDLWSVPAYLRRCAPRLGPDEVEALQRADPRAWTVSDLPFLDAARQRIGDPEASRRQRRRDAALAAEREVMDRVIDDLIAADDSELGVMKMLRGADAQYSLVDEAGLPTADPDVLAGPFAHLVVDEAQELTDAEWQMLLLRCPSRSFTIVGDRAQAQARVHGDLAGASRADRARPDHHRLPEHQLPHTGGGHGRGRARHPGGAPRRQRADLDPQQRPPRRPRCGVGPGLDPRDLARRAWRRDRLRHRHGRRRVRRARTDLPRAVAAPPSCRRGSSSTSSSSSTPSRSGPASKERSTATSR